ncbi:PREDICTED: uncharacterized protein LOC106808799 [Priapulus caudatus]|uniref:Uncharacterized protein LOC106808799 n=1 Tax=Priapulus caudatus TaxID=37621 RepID=A0ABM1E4L6_PRICU|nr:PREDICTED: uncharacterized protein LOC106808799 [Priapulus caudatus]
MEFAHFLADVLRILNRLSLALQIRTMSIAEVLKLLSDAATSLKRVKSPGAQLRKIQSTPGVLQDIQLLGNPPANGTLIKTVDSLVGCLENRFSTPDAIVDAAATVLNFKSWPGERVEDFGDTEIVKIVDYFGPVLDTSGFSSMDIEAEWTTVKRHAYG